MNYFYLILGIVITTLPLPVIMWFAVDGKWKTALLSWVAVLAFLACVVAGVLLLRASGIH
jgi:hypothetical protein